MTWEHTFEGACTSCGGRFTLTALEGQVTLASSGNFAGRRWYQRCPLGCGNTNVGLHWSSGHEVELWATEGGFLPPSSVETHNKSGLPEPVVEPRPRSHRARPSMSAAVATWLRENVTPLKDLLWRRYGRKAST